LTPDCKDDAGIPELEAAIARGTSALPELRTPFPAAWFAIKDDLAAMQRDYITFEEYRVVYASKGESDDTAQDQLSNALRCLGISLDYRNNLRLHDMAVLKPDWVTEAVNPVLNHPLLVAQNSELQTSDLRLMLDRKRYPPERYRLVVDLMRKFKPAMPFPKQYDYFLVPEQLPLERPDGSLQLIRRQA
jgi:internalin A